MINFSGAQDYGSGSPAKFKTCLAEVCVVPVFLVMVALWKRADHYIFMLLFVLFLLLSSFLVMSLLYTTSCMIL